MKNPRSLKFIRYTACMNDINESFSVLTGSMEVNKDYEMRINKILLNSMPNRWSRQLFVQVFDCETITKKSANNIERMEISESMLEGVVEPYYKKPTRADANRAGHIRKMRGESNLSDTCSEMSESASKCRKRYVDHPKDRFKITHIIHGPGKFSDECKVLGDFGSKYSRIRTTKDRG